MQAMGIDALRYLLFGLVVFLTLARRGLDSAASHLLLCSCQSLSRVVSNECPTLHVCHDILHDGMIGQEVLVCEHLFIGCGSGHLRLNLPCFVIGALLVRVNIGSFRLRKDSSSVVVWSVALRVVSN